MATTPNRKDAYMGAMKKPGGKPRASMSASDPKSKPMTSKLAPTKSPRTKSAPVRIPQAASFTYREAPGKVPATSTSKLAPAASKRATRDPRKKQKTYPGRDPYNYAV